MGERYAVARRPDAERRQVQHGLPMEDARASFQVTRRVDRYIGDELHDPPHSFVREAVKHR
jgi:hypothetical protein